MNTELFHIFKIDNLLDEPTCVHTKPENLNEYAENLIVENSNRKNKRAYVYKDEKGIVSTQLEVFCDLIRNGEDFSRIEEGFFELCNFLSKKLLQTQKNFKERYPGINEPKKGSLICFLNKDYQLLISKVDHEGYLNENNYDKETGLPEEKPSQKSAFFKLNMNKGEVSIQNIIVSDTNPSISVFWYDDFLELTELNQDEKLTTQAFNWIQRFISNNVANVSETDSIELKNNSIGYFSTSESFNIEEASKYIFGSYTPNNSSLKIKDIKENFENQGVNNLKDTSFSIKRDKIISKMKRTYPITDNIELRLLGEVNNMRNKIFSEKTKKGGYILLITDISEEVYLRFSKNDFSEAETYKNKLDQKGS